MVSSGLQVALLHRAAALPLGLAGRSVAQPWQPHHYLPTVPANRQKCASAPCDVLQSANEKQVACWVRCRERRTHPTAAPAHIPEAAQGVTSARCTGLLCPDLSLHAQAVSGGMLRAGLSLRPPQPFLLWGTGPGLGCGQEGSQSLSHWEGTVGSRVVVSVGRIERMGRSRQSLPSI